ncbi:hypothetical protein AAFA46_01065 [Oscillospiraceae bacterium WX1]
MRTIKALLLSVITILSLAGTASAANFDSAGNKFDMAGDVIADKSVQGDYVAFGQTVKLEAGVTGDIIAGGRSIVITDDNAVQNIFAMGQTVTVRAKSARNIYGAGSDVTISAGTEAKGVYLAGASLNFGGTATDLYMAGTTVTVDGSILNDAVIRSDHITFGRNATVGGHVTIYATVKPELPPTIDASKVTFQRVMHRNNENASNAVRGISRMAVIMGILAIVTDVLLAIFLTLFRGGYFKQRAVEFKKRWGKTLLFGLIALIVIPVAALICMVTIVAIPLSIIVLIVYGIVLYLAPAVTGIVLGRLLLPRLNRYLSSSLGAAAIKILLFVPYVRVLLYLACALYTLGITVFWLRPRRENNTDDPKPRIA